MTSTARNKWNISYYMRSSFDWYYCEGRSKGRVSGRQLNRSRTTFRSVVVRRNKKEINGTVSHSDYNCMLARSREKAIKTSSAEASRIRFELDKTRQCTATNLTRRTWRKVHPENSLNNNASQLVRVNQVQWSRGTSRSRREGAGKRGTLQ